MLIENNLNSGMGWAFTLNKHYKYKLEINMAIKTINKTSVCCTLQC